MDHSRHVASSTHVTLAIVPPHILDETRQDVILHGTPANHDRCQRIVPTRTSTSHVSRAFKTRFNLPVATRKGSLS